VFFEGIVKGVLSDHTRDPDFGSKIFVSDLLSLAKASSSAIQFSDAPNGLRNHSRVERYSSMKNNANHLGPP
jgi:hypothetical protein